MGVCIVNIAPPPQPLKGVGFLRACLLAALPRKVFLPPRERDARAPSTRCAGNAGVPPAMPTAREKTYPFKGGWEGGKILCACLHTGASAAVKRKVRWDFSTV